MSETAERGAKRKTYFVLVGFNKSPDPKTFQRAVAIVRKAFADSGLRSCSVGLSPIAWSVTSPREFVIGTPTRVTAMVLWREKRADLDGIRETILEALGGDAAFSLEPSFSIQPNRNLNL